MMCAATQYPEAIPLHLLKAKPITNALIRFFSNFGLPKLVQTHQVSNFLSRLFKQVLQQFSIKHEVAAAYHPESQGALERFHQNFKSMFCTYCCESANTLTSAQSETQTHYDRKAVCCLFQHGD